MSSQPFFTVPLCSGGGHGTNGIHFEEASVIFSGLLLTAPDERQDYGEKRLRTTQRVGRRRDSHQP